eukprot:1042504_1
MINSTAPSNSPTHVATSVPTERTTEQTLSNIESASTWSPVPDNKDHDTVLLVSAVVLGVCVFCCCRKHKEDIDNPYQRDQIKHDLPPPAQIAMLVPANTGNVLQWETPGKHTLTWSIPLEENSEHGSEDETANLEEESDSDARFKVSNI